MKPQISAHSTVLSSADENIPLTGDIRVAETEIAKSSAYKDLKAPLRSALHKKAADVHCGKRGTKNTSFEIRFRVDRHYKTDAQRALSKLVIKKMPSKTDKRP